MTYLALDLSKWSTGWALWDTDWQKPRFGTWQLGSEYTPNGRVYANLHKRMNELWKFHPFERLYFEEPISPGHLTGGTTAQTLWLLGGLAGHAESFGEIKRMRMIKPVNVERWRKDFIGQMVVKQIKAGVRRKRQEGGKASATDQLKKLTIERCKQLGFQVRKNDEADAIGILTYSVLLDGVTPPWLASETLRPIMEAGEA